MYFPMASFKFFHLRIIKRDSLMISDTWMSKHAPGSFCGTRDTEGSMSGEEIH